MHTRSVFLKHEDTHERDSGKVLQTFSSSRHYLFSNERKRFREQSDFHGQKSQALVLRGEKIIGYDFCMCQEEMQKKGLITGEESEEKELLILSHLFCMLLYSIFSECDSQLFLVLSLKLLNWFILSFLSPQHKKKKKKFVVVISLLSAFSVSLNHLYNSQHCTATFPKLFTSASPFWSHLRLQDCCSFPEVHCKHFTGCVEATAN